MSFINKSEEEKAVGLQRAHQLKQVFQPVVEATKESTKQITEQLQKSDTNKETWDSSSNERAIDFYLKNKK